MTENLPERPFPLWHPAHLIATWFGSGYAPFASGTVGSFFALPFAAVLAWFGRWPLLLVGAIAIFLIGTWATRIYLERLGGEDPKPVVVDEVAGQWLSLLPAATDWRLFLVGFFFFRLFDVWKPWPANWADDQLGGALGVMLDDIFAGIYALIVVALVARFVL